MDLVSDGFSDLVYATKRKARNVTKTYLSEIKQLAKPSGKEYGCVERDDDSD